LAADLLRRAAALLRERGNAATPGWAQDLGRIRTPTVKMAGLFRRVEDAEYAALMHPPVALALADWLQFEADAIPGPPQREAVVLARAILREES
jgi:hypothetical protein